MLIVSLSNERLYIIIARYGGKKGLRPEILFRFLQINTDYSENISITSSEIQVHADNTRKLSAGL
jgi:hypothetical protein